MFCQNCGSKLEDNAYVCVNCGILLKKRSKIKETKERHDVNTLGIVSIALGFLAIILAIMLFFHDISSVGMYTEIYERLFYTLDYSLGAILMATVALVFSLIGKRTNYSNIGLLSSIISFFFIITEFVVVVIY